MRLRRLKPKGRSVVYHCISRIVGGSFLLGEVEKEVFRRMMWKQSQFCGVEVVAYCLMSNHVHLAVRVPAEQELPDGELIRRLGILYGSNHPITKNATSFVRNGEKIPKAIHETFSSRMGDVSEFNKELKQRFSRWYNRVHQRHGTLWAERFRSIVVEPSFAALQALIAYIDLNPVRAGLVEDPMDYRFCSYSEALAGRRDLHLVLVDALGCSSWAECVNRYRRLLFVKSGIAGGSGKQVLSERLIRSKLKKGAALSFGEVLRVRIRYFSKGIVLGSSEFVHEFFRNYREYFGRRPRFETGRLPDPLRLQSL